MNKEIKITIKDIEKAIERIKLEESDISMFCPDCGCGIHKHIFGANNKAFEVKFCPFCGAKMEW